MSCRTNKILQGRYTKILQSKAKSGTELIDVSFIYQTCKQFCGNVNFPASAELAYSVGIPRSLGNSSWLVPIYVSGSVTYPSGNCGCDRPESFQGEFFYAVESSSTCAPCVTIDDSASKVVALPINLNCDGKTNHVLVSESILITTA